MSTRISAENSASVQNSSQVLIAIAIAWLIVIVPAVWGLEHTVQNAIKIFTRPATAITAPTTTGPATH